MSKEYNLIYVSEMRKDFLNAIPKGNDPKHRGVFIDAVHHHTSLMKKWAFEVAGEIQNVVTYYLFIYV